MEDSDLYLDSNDPFLGINLGKGSRALRVNCRGRHAGTNFEPFVSLSERKVDSEDWRKNTSYN